MTTSVRAAVLRAGGQPVTVETLELIEPRAGEVRIRVLASGVCHSDLHVRDGDWPRPTPMVMGHEGAGVVEAVGPGTTLRVGQPVAQHRVVADHGLVADLVRDPLARVVFERFHQSQNLLCGRSCDLNRVGGTHRYIG